MGRSRGGEALRGPGQPPTATAPAARQLDLSKETAMTQRDTALATATPAIRPFRVQVPEEALEDLRRRIAATRWPERETIADESQGVQLATMQELIRYWGTEYDLRRFETRLNALPQF